MNFFANTRVFPPLFVMWFLCVCALGCGSMPWQKQAIISYQTAGAVLTQSREVLKSHCADGVLDAEECGEAKEAYDFAVDIYKLMGNQVIIALDNSDDSIYKQLMKELSIALEALNKFVLKEIDQ